MFKTIATSSSYQLLLKDNCYGLDDEDITTMLEALKFAHEQLDIDNLDASYRLGQIIEALEKTTDNACDYDPTNGVDACDKIHQH
jgi:hypothetical protein